MGAAVTRIDPKTGCSSVPITKGDDGKLYDDYLHARKEKERQAAMPKPTEAKSSSGRVFAGVDNGFEQCHYRSKS